MKLAVQQLEQHLHQSLSPIYIVSSDEMLLVQEATHLIRTTALQKGFAERTLITIEANNTWENVFYAHAQSLSLFSTKQLIELNFHHAKFNATHGKTLQAYVANPAKDTLVIIRTNKVDAKTEKSAWFQTLIKNSTFISIWPIPAAQLPQWILQRAQKMNLTLSKTTAEKIAAQAEGNLLAIQQEIEKLSLLQLGNTTPPTNQSSLDNLTDNARFDVFDLVESVLAGNQARSLRILKNLYEEDVEPTLILWALTREIRILSDMHQQLKRGITLASLLNQFHIFEKRQSSVRAFLQRVSLAKCFELLLSAAHIDRIIKGAETGNVWNELEKFLLLG